MPQNDPHTLIGRAEIASIRGITRKTVRNYISSGVLPPPDAGDQWYLSTIMAWHRNRPLCGASNLWLTRMTREEADEAGRLWRD